MSFEAEQKRVSRAWVAAALLGVLVLGVSCSESNPDPMSFAHGGLKKLVVLKKAPPQPATVIKGPDGRDTTLAAFRGKVLVVNFWASWCEPCKKEMPTLGVLAEAFKGKDVVVMPLTVDKPEDRDLAQATLKQYAGVRLALYQAPSYDIAFDVQAAGFPTTIVYDRKGVEIARVSGEGDWSSREAYGLIDAALKK